MDTIGVGFQMQIPDNILNAYYGKFGKYLRDFKRPLESTRNQEWWNTFIQLLDEIKTYMVEFFRVPRAFFQMNEIGLKLYEETSKHKSAQDYQKRISRVLNNLCITSAATPTSTQLDGLPFKFGPFVNCIFIRVFCSECSYLINFSTHLD